ncbi:tryptophan-rich sensory protein [Legionella spiritensis]|uniref:Tryptophan-rich sensory protein n=2 Tax=Legionella spiritensis TaxID=452 RepID=A0A0W0Z0R3_LEGSP|nr:tryptophan-rich sensory protein [Legionella spiritensis]SNV31541.1 tryptophan-rich sensory protein [Legionella spiritensis]VEG92130.1 tryptophan-rich sensory protein [Legionella spiritensis]
MRKCGWITLFLWIITFQIIGFFLGLITKANMGGWYDALQQSWLTPPPFVFSIAWSVLYTLLAIVGFLFWQNQKQTNMKPLFNLYLLQLVMNWAWPILFFQLRWTGFCLVWLFLLTCLVGWLMVRVKKIKNVIALLLVPYVIWLLFATYLNGVIWLYN